ncbi:MAG: site-specific integrase [Bradyrhizobium sp.]|nr:site-specific integrase [Bradyrhizobium sp.]
MHNRGGRQSKGARLHLREVKRPGERRRWVILDISPTGRRIERSTGAFEGDLAAAEKAHRQYLAEKHEPSFGNGHPDKVLIVDVLTHYAKGKTKAINGANVATARARDKLARSLLLLGEFFDGKVVGDITEEQCRDYVEHRIGKGDVRFTKNPERRKSGLKATTARNELIILKAAQNYCVANRKLTHAVKVWMPPPSAGRPRMLTHEEAMRLLWGSLGWDQHGRRYPKRINYHLARFILIGLLTGTRSDRIRRLQWIESVGDGWVDLDKGLLHRMASGETETKKKAPSVPLSDRLMRYLPRWRRMTNRYVIECYGRPITDSLMTAFEGASELAGLYLPPGDPNRVTPHTLRHTCVSWLLEEGRTLFQVGKYVGMSAQTIERVYGHVRNEVQRDTANSIGGGNRRWTAPRLPHETARKAVNG